MKLGGRRTRQAQRPKAGNAAIAAIRARNQQSLRAMRAFRAETTNREAAWERFGRLKHEQPFIGLVPCRASGIDFTLFSANDDQVAWEYQWFGADAYETEIVRTWVGWCRERPGQVYDIGAYTGLMSVLAAKANPANRVHLFEPMARTIERAKINVRANGVERRVTLHNAAASDSEGQASINLYRDENFLGSGNSVDAKEGVEVRGTKTIDTVRVDDLLPGGSPSTVKIDVEGHELAVLRGMEATIERARPRIIVEVWEHSRPETLALLDKWGYGCEPFEETEQRVMNYRCVPA